VHRYHNLIKTQILPTSCTNVNFLRRAPHRLNCGIDFHCALKPLLEPFYISKTAPDDGLPPWLLKIAKKTVILKEIKEGDDRKIHHRFRRARPDRGANRDQVILDDPSGKAVPQQPTP
jgi:hypothetical protein